MSTFQKISSTQGNFTGPLADSDQFSVAAGLGDLNRDGVPDLAVGTFMDDGDQFGYSLTMLVDLNGDGISEPVAGLRWDDDGGTDRGAVFTLFLEREP